MYSRFFLISNKAEGKAGKEEEAREYDQRKENK
jgi:hypothetical protein